MTNGGNRKAGGTILWVALAWAAAGAGLCQVPAQRDIRPPDPKRVAEIAAMLPARPEGFGRPISDRDAWDKVAQEESYAVRVRGAEKIAGKPVPELPDSLYLDFSKTGNRTRWQSQAGKRSPWGDQMALAECVENKGRFVQTFEDYVRAICAEKTWVMPAHDRSLKNFNGTTVDIDLRSSALAFELGEADYLLGNKLSRETRELIRREVTRRVLKPFREMAEGKRGANGWMKGTNNWNAVCHCGIAGAALTLLEDAKERAFYVAAIEDYIMNFLAGFPKDGYCTEGVGYWNYGYGRFVILAELLRQQTKGGVDLMGNSHAEKAGSYGARIQIINNVSPAFADCGVTAVPQARIMYFVSRRYKMGIERYDSYNAATSGGWLPEAMMYTFPNIASETPPAPGKDTGPGIRSWFESVGILIGRPGAGSSCRMGVALKGGNNAEHHNHNDVGSYIVVVGDEPLVADPGGEVYTARTFSKDRYVSKVLNSFGHSVPVVAGQLQRTGAQAAAKVVKTDFTDAADTLALDIASCYEVPELTALTRTFVFSRAGEGSLTITDEAAFRAPELFGTAVVTLSPWRKQDDGSILIYDLTGAVRVTVDAGGAAWDLQAETLNEDTHTKRKPERLGIYLKDRQEKAKITVKVETASLPGMEAGQLLRNGGFELGDMGWSLDKGISTIVEENASSGKASLKITDDSKTAGSSATSSRIAIGAGRYELRGKVFVVSGDGVGMYMKYYDANRTQLNESDGKGNIQPVGGLPSKDKGKWVDFRFPFETPAGTEHATIWIHSFNGSVVTAFVDDLEVTVVEGAKK